MERNSVMKSISRLALIWMFIYAVPTVAQVTDLDVGVGKSYYYTDHFEVIIDRPVSEVWPHVLTMGLWMPWMATEESPSGTVSEGKKVQLYGDNYIEVVKIIPKKMVLLANHPNTQNGESSHGVAMVSVVEANGKTLVSIFMSRLYGWFEAAPSTQRSTREAEDFAKQRKEMFQGKFLEKLRLLSEQNHS
jgi:hypothetical protein